VTKGHQSVLYKRDDANTKGLILRYPLRELGRRWTPRRCDRADSLSAREEVEHLQSTNYIYIEKRLRYRDRKCILELDVIL